MLGLSPDSAHVGLSDSRSDNTIYTRRQINLYLMFFADFSVNSYPILQGLFSSHAATTAFDM